MNSRLALLALLSASALLAGCGKVAELERPRPMFGTPSDAAPETDARRDAAVHARADAQKTNPPPDAPQSIEELRNYGLPGSRLREQPIQAAPGDPDASNPASNVQAPPAPAQPTPTTPQ